VQNFLGTIWRQSRCFIPWPLYKRILLHNTSNPYKPVNDKLQAIFVHVPKNAGISIEETVFGEKVGHHYAVTYRAHSESKFRSYFTFSFVRNPYDRFVSAYFFLKAGGRNSDDRKWSDAHLNMFDDVNSFASALAEPPFRKEILKKPHFRPQYKFLCDLKLRPILDYIGRFENLEEDFSVITKRLQLNACLPHYNKSDHTNYQQLLNPASKTLLRKLYAPDVSIFGYSP